MGMGCYIYRNIYGGGGGGWISGSLISTSDLAVSTVAVSDRNHKTDIGCWWQGARCCSVVRAFAHGAMGRRIDPSWGGPIELFLVPASVP